MIRQVSPGLAAGDTKAAATVAAIPGYGPASLRQAYQLTAASANGGLRATVAVVDAYSDPAAASDLAAYRSHYKLPACTLASACLRIVNEHGLASPLPAANASWAKDESANLDMVSAICPNCHIVLVEASSNSLTDLGTAEDAAIALGAKFVDNSWGSLQAASETSLGHYFNHPGAAVVFASGNGGYQTYFPAASPYVVSVGGTTLRRASNTRGWSETAWAHAGSGCSIFEAKPSWQRADASPANGCLNRTLNDVAAVADPSTGVSVYDSYGTTQQWNEFGGTGVAAAIVTAVYALAGRPASATYPANYLYRKSGHLYDITSGGSGTCTPTYLCTAVKGYDGPTGLGTPDGIAAFTPATNLVTVLDPGTQDHLAGTAFSLRIRSLDARAGATSLSYTAAGLPAGLVIGPVAGSTDGMITGTLPGTVGTYDVTVTARDVTSGRYGVTYFTIVGAGSLRPSAPATGSVQLGGFGGWCLDGGNGSAGTSVTLQSCTGVQLPWSYLPDGGPDAPGTLTVGGNCLALVSNSPVLATCTAGASDQAWTYHTGGLFENAATATCLGTTSASSKQLVPVPCGQGFDSWYLDLATIQSAVPGMCLATTGNAGSPVMVGTCGSYDNQGLMIGGNTTIMPGLYTCLAASGAAIGASVVVGNCAGGSGQDWVVGPNGELINDGAGLCLDDPGNATTSGTTLVLEPCYGQLGEIWAYS